MAFVLCGFYFWIYQFLYRKLTMGLGYGNNFSSFLRKESNLFLSRDYHFWSIFTVLLQLDLQNSRLFLFFIINMNSSFIFNFQKAKNLFFFSLSSDSCFERCGRYILITLKMLPVILCHVLSIESACSWICLPLSLRIRIALMCF